MLKAVEQRFASVVALALVAASWGVTHPAQLAAADLRDLAGPLAFDVRALPFPEGVDTPTDAVRTVAPALHHIRSWISSVGAGVAVGDLSGDGLPDEACVTDARALHPFVHSLSEPAAFEPFQLSPAPHPYDETMAPMGCRLADLTEDGWNDVLVYYWGRSPVLFARLPGGEPTAERFRATEVVDPYEVWNTNAVTIADVNSDGHADLIVGNYFPDDARVLDATAHVDPVMQMQDSMSRAFNAGANRLLLWDGTGPSSTPGVRFRSVNDAFTVDEARGWTLALAAADLDGDLRPEIYVANDFGPDRLFHNRSEPGRVELAVLEGTRTAATPASKVLGRDSFKGMGADVADVDDDGKFDIAVSNIAADWSLHESHFLFLHTGQTGQEAFGRAPYVDASEELATSRSGWSWDVKLADLDNSGQEEILQTTGFVRGENDRWPELHELAMGNDTLLRDPAMWPRFAPGDDLSGHQPNAVFKRASDGRFYDVAGVIGLGGIHVSRGLGVADFDADGCLDVVIANQWEPSHVARNTCAYDGGFVGFDLLLPVGEDGRTHVRPGRTREGITGRAALSATVRVHTDGPTLVAQVDGGNGHSGQRDTAVHVGLGELRPTSIEIRYRNRDGVPRTLVLPPLTGWHTIVLGATGEVQR
ncbi:MAG TPA: CRTAC1 family protein [Nitriliruptorales bacterium]|nr:CRTAC1 family protein [Nitriliruptorales bacterium]